jgi:hypothetical protein
MKWFILSLISILILVGLVNLYKKTPEGISMSGQVYDVPNDSVKFLSDKTRLVVEKKWIVRLGSTRSTLKQTLTVKVTKTVDQLLQRKLL